MSALTALTALALALGSAAPARAAGGAGTGGAGYPPPSAAVQAPAPAPAPADTGGGGSTSDPAPGTDPGPLVAALAPGGTATVPAGVPSAVAEIVAAANRIATLPYRYGGGHRSFRDSAYDCSGSVSYALRGAGLLQAPLDSTGLARWGRPGPGRWLTIYANKTHTFLVVAGLRFDTSGQRQAGSRWQPMDRSVAGFAVRHPDGL